MGNATGGQRATAHGVDVDTSEEFVRVERRGATVSFN